MALGPAATVGTAVASSEVKWQCRDVSLGAGGLISSLAGLWRGVAWRGAARSWRLCSEMTGRMQGGACLQIWRPGLQSRRRRSTEQNCEQKDSSSLARGAFVWTQPEWAVTPQGV